MFEIKYLVKKFPVLILIYLFSRQQTEKDTFDELKLFAFSSFFTTSSQKSS